MKAVAVTIFLLLTACAGTDDVIRLDPGPRVHLESEDRILIAVPTDIAYRGGSVAGSGDSTARLVHAAFAEHSDNVGPLPDSRNLGDVHAMAGRENYDYLVTPTIFRWDQDAANDGSAPYRIEIKIDVVDLATDEVVASGLTIGRSEGEASGGDQSEIVLFTPIEDFVASLYRSSSKGKAWSFPSLVSVFGARTITQT